MAADFKEGFDDPQIIPDPRSGVWNSESKSASTLAIYLAIIAGITDPRSRTILLLTVGDDAVETFEQYFKNTGNDHTIDLEEMVSESRQAKSRYDSIVAQFKSYVEGLPLGTHRMVRARPSASHFGRQAARTEPHRSDRV